MMTVTPNIRELMGNNDAESIQNAIDYAKDKGIDSVTLPRINERTGKPLWTVGEAIIIPSNMEIVLDNCHIVQEDGSFDNIFRTFRDPETEGHTNAETKRNIVIRGRGNAVLDGGKHNGLTQQNSMKDGLPHVTRNSLILLYNIRDFVLEGFEVRDQRYWAIDLIHAERGRISDIFVNGQCDCRNQDGIDLRVGCSDIIIERIRGQAGDDIVALSAIGNNSLPHSLNNLYRVEGRNEDIHNVIIKDIIATSVECAVIGIRNCDGRKIYDITLDNIHCTDNYAKADGKLFPDYPKYQIPKFDVVRIRESNAPYTLIRIGQPGYHEKRDSVLGELYNIHATNLHMQRGCVILANVALENCYFGNIYADNDVDYIFTTKEARTTQLYGADMRSVLIENVFMHNVDNKFATAFDFDVNRRQTTVEGVIIKNAFLGNCINPFNVCCEGEVVYSGLYGSNVSESCGVIRKKD